MQGSTLGAAGERIREIVSRILEENGTSPFCGGRSCADPLCALHAGKHLRRLLERAAENPDQQPPRLLASLIDQTLLRQDATRGEIRAFCEEAAIFGFAAVCVNPSFVPLAHSILKGTAVKVCAAIAFPLGTTTTDAKTFEARKAMRDGAGELDVVMHVGLLKSGALEEFRDDIASVAGAARQGGCLCKVILETALLSDEEKIRACVLAMDAGAAFVKTSTGFGRAGATPQDVALLRRTVGRSVGVKASGGIQTREDAVTMIASGASRIGTSSGPALLQA